MSQALINPSILSWSRQRAGLSEFDVAHGLPVKPEKVFEWESGESLPTFKQAQKWATIAHIPFGFLFLKSPPAEELPLPDLRTVGGAVPSKPSLNLIDTIKDVLGKYHWYLEYLNEHQSVQLPFVGRFSVDESVGQVVADMRQTLGVVENTARPAYDEYFRTLVAAAEAVGILVMRSGIVGANTHRKLDVGEFRGFALSDAKAPVVFINSADAPSARLFTLIHELAHIWIGSSGISSGSINIGRQDEVFCNAVAGEFLVPEASFLEGWNHNVEWFENLPILASHFRVSKLVIARRACDLNLISNTYYSNYYLTELESFRNKEKSGGSFYLNAGAKNSNRFSKAVLAEALSGRILLRDAAKLLGLQPSKIKTYAASLGE
jgi:Zn-dependent peptidase ImmA (M78 family)/transcriptional regulator with XRE-family HTH domain